MKQRRRSALDTLVLVLFALLLLSGTAVLLVGAHRPPAATTTARPTTTTTAGPLATLTASPPASTATAVPATSAPVPTAQATPTSAIGDDPTLLVQGTNGHGVAVRDEPEGKRIATVDEGQRVADLIEQQEVRGREWRKVRAANGTVGWAAIEYLADGDGPLWTPPVYVAEETPDKTPIPVDPLPLLPPAMVTAPAPPTAQVRPPALLPRLSATPLPTRAPVVASICRNGGFSYDPGPGACADRGGVIASSASGSSASTSSGRRKTVSVRGYTRRDGTYVRPHTRSAPRRR